MGLHHHVTGGIPSEGNFGERVGYVNGRGGPEPGKTTPNNSKQDKEPASPAARLGHICPQCGQISGLAERSQKTRKTKI